MNNLVIFQSSDFGQIRTTMDENGEPLFCLADVCKALELRAPDVKRRLDDAVVSTHTVVDSLGRKNMMSFVNEDVLYDVILDSRKAEARQFRKWVTSVVLPSIRRNGAYLTDDALARFAEDPDYGIKLLNTLKRERTERLALMKENVTLSLENERMKPMADYCAKILACTDTVTVTQIAQDYGMTAQDFNEMLADMKIQYRCGRQWILYSGYKQQGFVQSATTTYTRYDGTKGVRVSSRWTQLGRIFLYERLKGEGVMPIGA